MDICNNRYRIIKELKTPNSEVKSFVVEDLWNPANGQQELKIIKMEPVDKEFVTFLRNNYYTIKNQNTDFYIKTQEFTKLFNIDGNEVEENLFLYISEYYENSISFDEFLKKAKPKEILESIIFICKALNFASNHRIKYLDINLKNARIIKNKNSFVMKVTDMISTKLYDAESIVQIKNENIRDFSYENTVLLEGFLSVIAKRQIKDINSKTIKEIEKEYSSSKLSKKDKKIIQCLINICKELKKNKKRVYHLHKIVEDINKTLDTDFSILTSKDNQKRIIPTQVIKTNKDKEKIFANLHNIEKGKESNNIFLINSHLGAGKTTFLEELYFLFSLENCSVYNIPTLGDFDDEKFIIYIVQKLILNTNSSNKEYEKEILESAEFIKKEKNNPKNASKIGMIKYKLANRIANLILEKVSNDSVIFIVDDIHLASNFIIDIFLYLAIESLHKKNLLLFFSYDKLAIKQNEASKKFIDILNSQKNITTINLKNLSQEETFTFISCVLETRNIPEIFIEKIYNHTSGNPLFIHEIIRELQNKNDIRQNNLDGPIQFSERICDESWDVKTSENIENSISKNLKKLTKKDIKVLNTMSIFKDTFTIDLLFKISDLDKISIEKSFLYLLKNNIIKKTRHGKDIEYSLDNKILQSTLYDKLNKSYTTKMHKKIFHIIENRSWINISELIWHAERANMKEEVIKYCLENKYYLQEALSSTEFIDVFEKILPFIDEKNVNEKLEAGLQIANMQMEISDIDNCDTTLQQIKPYTLKVNVEKKFIASFYTIKLLNNLQKNMSIEQIKQTLSKATKAIKESDDILTEIRFLHAKTIYLYSEKKLDEALVVAKKVVSICSNNRKLQKEKAIGLLNIGRIHYYKFELEKAESAYIQTVNLAKRIQAIKVKDTASNNLAIIYSNYRHDYASALDYYNEIIQSNDGFTSSSMQITAILNSARTNLVIGEYEKSYEHTLDAVKKLIKTPHPNRMLYAYTTLYENLFMLRKPEDAINYEGSIKKLFKDKKILQNPIYNMNYFETKANIAGYLGEFEKEKKYFEEALAIDNIKMPIRKFYIKIFYETNKLITGESNNSKKLIDAYNKLKHKKEFNENINQYYYKLLCNTRRLLMACPNIKIKNILKLLTSVDIETMSTHMKASNLFLTSFLEPQKKEEFLAEANFLIKNSFDINFKIDINTQLGLYYLKQNNLNMAISKFIEVQSLIKKLIKDIPENKQVSFFNAHKYARPFIIVNDFLNKQLEKDYVNFNKDFNKKKIQEFLNSDLTSTIKNNEDFISDLVRQTIEKSPTKNKDFNSIINNFTGNFLSNLKSIANFIGLNLLASHYDIFISDEDGHLYSIFDFTHNYNEENKKMQKIKNLIMENDYESMEDIDNNRHRLIFPIKYYNDIQMKKTTFAYVIYLTENELNNFGKFGKDLFKEVAPLFSFLIQSYQFQTEASTDRLTKALSRKYTEIAFKDLIINSKKNNKKFSVLMYDLDKFKKVNDTFGHQVGDTVLTETAKTVQRLLSDEQVIGRYGGEEFLVLLPNMSQKETFLFAEKMRKAIEQISFSESELKISVSIGISFFPHDGDTMNELFLKADHALYNAKNNGRNQVCIWDKTLKVSNELKDEFTGFISSDSSETQKRISGLIDSISMIKKDMSKPHKLNFCLNRVTELTGAEKGIFITIKKDQSISKTLKAAKDKNPNMVLNQKIIKSVIQNKKGLYQIDWDNVAEKNKLTGIPTWNSVIACPIIKNTELKALLYLTVTIRKKEFDIEEFNLANIFAKSIAPYF